MEFTQTGLQVLPMNERQQNSVIAGIPMFEIRGFIGEEKIQQMHGPFNVHTTMDTSEGRARPIVNWLNGNRAIIQIESRKSGVGVSYFPDDPWWHNRIYLLGLSKVFSIAALHTNKGVIPGDVVMQQLKLLNDRIKEETTMYRILKDGFPISDRDTKIKAEKEIESMKMVSIQLDSTTGQQRPVALNTSVFEIVEIKVSDFKPEIKKLAKEYRNLEYGWTECPEFQAIKKDIIAKFKELQAPPVQQQVNPVESLKDMLSGISKEEKMALLTSILGGDDTAKEEKTAAKRGSKPKEKIETVEV